MSDFVDWNHLQHQLRAAWKDHIGSMAEWAASVGASPESCDWLGLGYRTDKKAITWPERNDQDEIVGIGCRDIRTGKRYMITGSRHGLIYAPDPKQGGVPAYLDHPILIVEGVTDVLACLRREIYALGLPTAKGTAESSAYLKAVVKGRDIALTCENDKGVGALAFLEMARPLSKVANDVYAIYPPLEVKDIRQWFEVKGDDAVLQIEDQIRYRRPWSDDPGIIAVSPDVLEDTAPLRIADAYLAEKQGSHEAVPVCCWHGRLYVFDASSYVAVDEGYLRTELYRFLDDKKVLEQKRR